MGDKMRELLTAKRRRGWYLALTLVLAVLVTAGVGGLFHQPAVAKTYQVTALTCTAEAPAGPGYAGYFVHTHNEDCFDGNGNLVCPLPEIKAHVHDETCYTTKAVQTCGLAESDGHQHTDACYTRVRGDLICEKSTDPVLDEAGNVLAEGHVHTDECFAWTEELTCGMEAGEGAHHHNDSCFEYVTSLSCGMPEVILHTHTDDCYQKNEDGSIYVDEDGNTLLICGLPEVTEHVHGPECFTVYELDDEEAGNTENTEGDESGLIFLFPEEEEEEAQPAESANPEAETGDTDATEDGNADPAEGNTPDTDETADAGDTDNTESTDSADSTNDTAPKAEGDNQEAASGETAPIAEEPHTVVYTGTRGAEKGGVTVLAEIPEGALDESAHLVLSDADESAARNLILQVVNANAAEGEEREISSMLLMDIGFVSGGEPAVLNGLDPIRVTLKAAAIRTMGAPKLFHLNGETVQEVKDVLFDAEAGTAVFTAAAFSPFAIVDLTGEDPVEETAVQAVSVSMPAQSFTGETEGVIVSVEAPEGAFPAGTTMVVSPVEMDDDTLSNVTGAVESSGEKKVVTAQAVDISFFDADGNLIEPKLPIKVSMKSALVSESENVALVHLAETAAAETVETETPEVPAATTAEVVTDVQVVENPDEDNEIQFESDAFSVYVLVGTETITTNYITADGETYTITVTYGPEAMIPAGATLAVAEIPQDSEEYAAYLAQAQTAVKAGSTAGSAAASAEPAEVTEEAAETPGETETPEETESAAETESSASTGGTTDRVTVTTARFFDITILDAEGNPVEPAAPVDVKIEYMEPAETAENYQVVHFGEETEVLNPAVSGTDGTASAFDFQASSFSVFGIVGLERITMQFISANGDIYEVTVTYGPEAGIPDHSSLNITEYRYDTVEYREAYDRIIEYKKSNEAGFVEGYSEAGMGFEALDISILGPDGDLIEPQSAVQVSITRNELPADIEEETFLETVEVQHIKNLPEGIVVEVVANTNEAEEGTVTLSGGTATAAFTVESFSTYTITWGGGLTGRSIQNITTGDYVIYAQDANDGNYYALVPSNNTQSDLRSVQLTYNNGLISYSGSNDLRWHVTVNGSGDNRTFTVSYSSGNNTYYVYPRSANLNDGYTSNLRVRTSSYTWSNWSNRIYCAGDTFLRSYNGTFQVWNQNNSNWMNMTNIFFASPADMKTVTVHYGYMDGNTFKEFDELPAGAQTSYSGPTMVGDQLNVRYDIPGKDYVTTRINSPANGTQISPLLQTEANSAAYWKYRVLDTLTVNDGINAWQTFGTNENDIYVIYRDTPTEKSYDDGDVAPEDLGAPVTNKNVVSNNDGTYDVSLSVTGTSNSVNNKTHANIVIVLDTSSSMSGTDTGVAGQTRLQAAQNAIYTLADQLFGFNTSDDPAAIEVAFVDFSHRVRNEMTKDTIYSGVVNGTDYNSFISLIRDLNTNGGTNYDTAIEAANSVLWNDADPVYVIFVTDGDTVSRGYLAYDNTGTTDHASDWDGGTYYNGDSTQTTEQYYARARSAAQIQLNKLLANSNNKFYSIGVFGTVQYLKDLGGTYLGQANDETAITNAFKAIISDIALELGYVDVTIKDGITALTSTALVNGTVDQFRYAVKTKAGVTTEYANGAALQAAYPGIGLASYTSDTKTVEWNMGSEYMLADGVTYTVSFTVWPSQDAYDYLADFNNKVKYITQQEASVKKQFVVEVGGSTYQFVENKGWTTDIPAKEKSTYITDEAMQNLISTASGVTHYLKTNTSASVDYTSVKTENGEVTGTTTVTGAEIRDPNGKMILDPSEMKVEKAFAHNINAEDPFARIRFYLKVDGQYYNKNGSLSDTIDPDKVYVIDLPTSENHWYDDVYIAPGLIKTVNGTAQQLLETGHDYTLEEVILEGNAYEYGFTPQTVRPMVIGSTGTAFLVLKDKYNTNSNGAAEYNIDGKTYYVDASSNGLVGTNRKTGELDITKKIVDNTGNFTDEQLDAETFTYRVKLTVPADADVSGITAYEYVARYNDAVNNNNRYTIFGYQNSEDEAVRGIESDVNRFSGKTYGGYTVTTSTANRQMTDMFTGSGDTRTATIDITLKRNEIIRFTNLPEGTTYEITEMYNNYRQADPTRDADAAGSTMAANISAQGYTATIATKSRNPVSGTVNTGSTNGTTVTGEINYLDTRYYNQFTNTLDDSAVVNLAVTKHLQGYQWSGEKYYVKLTGDSLINRFTDTQRYLTRASGSDDVTYTYASPLRFAEAGEYSFTFTEYDSEYKNVLSGKNAGGIRYGEAVTVTVKVEEVNGKLTITDVQGGTLSENRSLITATITNSKGIELQLLKLGNGDFSKPLEGVQFKLYNNQDCTDEHQVKTDLTGASIGTDGLIVTSSGDSDKGMAYLGSLGSGTYYLKEVAGHSGYNVLSELITITIDAGGRVSYSQSSYGNSSKGPDLVYKDKDGKSYYFSNIRNDESDAYKDNNAYTFSGYRIIVSNQSGVELPQTGGEGTLIFSVLGTILILSSTLLILAKRKQEAYTPRH